MNATDIVHQLWISFLASLPGFVVLGGILWTLAQKFVDHRFYKLQQEEATRQSLQLESGKVELGKSSKIYDKELEILPTAWSKMQIAIGFAADLTAPLQTNSDISVLSDDELDTHLQTLGFGEVFRKRVLMSTDRQREYMALIPFYKISVAEKARAEFNNYIIDNAVFMEQSIYDLLESISTLLRSALISYRIGAETIQQAGANRDGFQLQEEARKSLSNAMDTVTAVRPLIQSRLHAASLGSHSAAGGQKPT